MVYPSLADCILLVMCAGIFFWFKSSIKNLFIRFTEKLDANALTVKDHLDTYNAVHERSWQTLSELVKELKEGKVWEIEYKSKVEYLESMGKVRDEKIEKLDCRILSLESNRRREDKQG
jgi:hypothetical protein